MVLLADILLAIVLIIAPLAYASVDLSVQAFLFVLSIIIFLILFFNRPAVFKAVFRLPFFWLGAFMGVWILFQMIPLPVKLLAGISPHTYDFYLNYLSANISPNTFLPLSICIHDTLTAMIQFVTYGCVFISTIARLYPGKGKTADHTNPGSLKKSGYLRAGCLVGVLAIIFHSLYDFNLHITANGIYFVFLLGLAIGTDKEGYDHAFFRQAISLIITIGFAVALFAIAQKFSYDGYIYWIGRPADNPVGPYVNYDHFAGFMAMCSSVAIAMSVASIFHTSFFHCQGFAKKVLWFSSAEANRSVRRFFMAGVMVATIFMSTSRGGIMSFALSQVIFFILILITAHKVGKAGRFWTILTAVVLMAGIVLVWLGPQDFLKRFHLTSVDRIIKMESPDSIRIFFYKDTLKVIRDFPSFGTGLGTFGTNFSRYRSFHLADKYLRYTHNDYLQLVSETGLAGWLFISGFLVLYLSTLRRSIRRLD